MFISLHCNEFFREKKCRLERLEMLVERQLMQSLRVQQQGNNHYGEYSFARDDTAAYKCGVGDYVDLVEAPKAAQHGRGAGRLDESNLKVNNTDIESNLVSSSKPKSTSGRLKKCLSRSPKQETSIYSYATHEPLLR